MLLIFILPLSMDGHIGIATTSFQNGSALGGECQLRLADGNIYMTWMKGKFLFLAPKWDSILSISDIKSI
jgi:hypothetical protein